MSDSGFALITGTRTGNVVTANENGFWSYRNNGFGWHCTHQQPVTIPLLAPFFPNSVHTGIRVSPLVRLGTTTFQ